MIKFARGPVLITIVAFIISALTGQWWIGLLTLMFSSIYLFSGLVRGHGMGIENVEKNLGEEAKWIVRPIRKLRNDLASLAENSASSASVSVIAQEAVAEADEIYGKAVNIAVARETVKRTLRNRGEAETELNRLQRQFAEAQSGPESDALEAALTAKQKELVAYDLADIKIKEFESKLKEAEAVLSELKSRLSTEAIDSGPMESTHDELNGMIGRLKVLGQSFEEAQQSLEVNQ